MKALVWWMVDWVLFRLLMIVLKFLFVLYNMVLVENSCGLIVFLVLIILLWEKIIFELEEGLCVVVMLYVRLV